MMTKNRTIRFLFMALFCLALMPLPGQARILIQTEVVSGVIARVDGNAVSLVGDQTVYYPDNERIKMELKPGNTVTLRYYVDHHGDQPTRKYFEYAPGKNTLAKIIPPRVDKTEK